jgi:hypothetical protein
MPTKQLTPDEIRKLISEGIKAAIAEMAAAPPDSMEPFWQKKSFWAGVVMVGIGLVIRFGGITTEMSFDDMMAYGSMFAGVITAVLPFFMQKITPKPPAQ